MRPLVQSSIRVAVFIAAAHFLVYHAVTGAYLVVPRAHGAPDTSAFWVLLRVLSVLNWPSDIFISRSLELRCMFPPLAAIPIAFASLVWSLAGCAIWLLGRRFIAWKPRESSIRVTRRFVFAVACVLLSWLFFGPVAGFAGDLMFGILDAGRHMDGQFMFRPLWVVISALLWALTIFAAYRFIFVPHHHASPATA
jgi:hypothetical protein